MSKSLQGKNTTIQEEIGAGNLAKGFYKRQRVDQALKLFYTDVLDTARKHEIGDPQLPRYRRAPRKFDSGSQPHMYNSPKEYFKQQYFEACDLLRALEKRFDQHQSLEPVFALENLLLKACNGEPYEEDLNVLEASCYQDDLDCDKLHHLLLFCAEVTK